MPLNNHKFPYEFNECLPSPKAILGSGAKGQNNNNNNNRGEAYLIYFSPLAPTLLS